MLLRFRFGGVSAVFLEGSRQRKLPEPVADHVLGYEHRIEHFAVVHIERQPNEIRSDHRTPRPGLDRSFRFRVLGLLNLLHQMTIDKRTFFD